MSGAPTSFPGSCPRWRSWVLTQATLGLLLGNLGVKISPVSLCLRTLESGAGRVFGQGIALYCGCCYCYLVQTLSPPPPHLTTSSPLLIETHSGDSRGFSVYIYTIFIWYFQFCYQAPLRLAQGRNIKWVIFLVHPWSIDPWIKSNLTDGIQSDVWEIDDQLMVGSPVPTTNIIMLLCI